MPRRSPNRCVRGFPFFADVGWSSMTVATSPPPAGWYVDPDGSGGQRYWDGERWTTQRRRGPSSPRSALIALADRVRRLWSQTPVVLRLTLPIALVLILVGVGFYAWSRPQ